MRPKWMDSPEKMDVFTKQKELSKFRVDPKDKKLMVWLQSRPDFSTDWLDGLFRKPEKSELKEFTNQELYAKAGNPRAREGVLFQAWISYALNKFGCQDSGDKGIAGDIWIGEKGLECKSRSTVGYFPNGTWLLYPSEGREYGTHLPEEQRAEAAGTRTEFTIFDWESDGDYTFLSTSDMFGLKVCPLSNWEHSKPDGYRYFMERTECRHYSNKDGIISMTSAVSYPTFAQLIIRVYSEVGEMSEERRAEWKNFASSLRV